MREYNFFVKIKVDDDCEFNKRDFEQGITLDLQDNPDVKEGWCIPFEEMVNRYIKLPSSLKSG
jgi:hypothetical protein